MERLITDGRMTPAGLAKIDAAKRDDSWTIYDAIEALTVPDDLADALSHQDGARAGFDAFSPTDKKQLLWWIESAKRPATRAKRIADVVGGAVEGCSPLNWRANKQRRAQG